MENSTSLRFLEASGRPSGTGRPSLPAPRADHERAASPRKPVDDARELRRKSRLQKVAHVDTPAAPVQPQEPFEKLLGGAQQPAVAGEQASSASDPAASVTSPPATAAPAKDVREPCAAKTKKVAARAPDSAPVAIADPEALAALPAASAPPAQAGDPRSGHLRPDALPLPSTDSVAPAGPALGTGDAPPLGDDSASTEPAPALAGDAQLALTPDLAQAFAEERSQIAQPALTPESRLESRAVEAKAPPAPPPHPEGSERAGEILRQLRVQLSPELRTATIQLSPPELGRISIRIRVHGGELRALVRAEKRETLDALQRHVPELESTLEQLGIRASVFDLQLGFEQQGARQGPNEPRPDGGAPGREHDPLAREHERRLFRTLSARAGGIDTYA